MYPSYADHYQDRPGCWLPLLMQLSHSAGYGSHLAMAAMLSALYTILQHAMKHVPRLCTGI